MDEIIFTAPCGHPCKAINPKQLDWDKIVCFTKMPDGNICGKPVNRRTKVEEPKSSPVAITAEDVQLLKDMKISLDMGENTR